MKTAIRMVGRRFLTVTPLRCTVLRQARHRRRDAVLDEHLRLVEIGAELERDRQCHPPSEVACEDMYSMSSTPLTSCSIGVATVSAITLADAPG